jgi:hypothetical protein
MRLAVDRLQDSDLCRNKLKSTSAAASAGCGGISWSCGAAPLPNAETTMDQSDDILDTPQLGYEAWRDRLRAMCGRYNPEGIETQRLYRLGTPRKRLRVHGTGYFLSRTFAMLLDALNRHRSKGTQKITVEHVYVHSGGQAVVGIVEEPGERFGRNRRIKPWIEENAARAILGRAHNLLDRRSRPGSSGEESRRFRANAGWEIALVFAGARIARFRSDRDAQGGWPAKPREQPPKQVISSAA